MKSFSYWVYLTLPIAVLGHLSFPAIAMPDPIKSPAIAELPLPPADPPPIGRLGGGGSYFRLPAPPAGPPPGGRSRGGAQRGTCQTVGTDLTALVPSIQEQTSTNSKLPSANVWGYTTQAQTTLWFYSPYYNPSHNQGTSDPMRFELQTAQGGTLYRTTVPLPTHPGIVPVVLPASNVTLEVGQRYRWFLKVNCAGKSSPPVYVEGLLQRVELSAQLSQQLSRATSPLEKAAIYAQNGIWHDALALLGSLQQQDSTAPIARSDWGKLLQDAGLGDLASQPIVQP